MLLDVGLTCAVASMGHYMVSICRIILTLWAPSMLTSFATSLIKWVFKSTGGWRQQYHCPYQICFACNLGCPASVAGCLIIKTTTLGGTTLASTSHSRFGK